MCEQTKELQDKIIRINNELVLSRILCDELTDHNPDPRTLRQLKSIRNNLEDSIINNHIMLETLNSVVYSEGV